MREGPRLSELEHMIALLPAHPPMTRLALAPLQRHEVGQRGEAHLDGQLENVGRRWQDVAVEPAGEGGAGADQRILDRQRSLPPHAEA